MLSLVLRNRSEFQRRIEPVPIETRGSGYPIQQVLKLQSIETLELLHELVSVT